MKRSKFSLSHHKLFTCDMGELVPAGLTEVLPGDSFQHATSALVRASPLLAPVMHPVHVRFHHFFVPTRLLWEDFENFITGGPDGMDDSEYPTVTADGNGFAEGSLADYLGIPTGVANLEVSALPFRAYAFIFNEMYRDQDLVASLGLSVAAGPDATTNTDLVNCAWEKDYFTSARPWEQKGADITLSIGDQAPVVFPNGVPSKVDHAFRASNDQDLGNILARGGLGDESLKTQATVAVDNSSVYLNGTADDPGDAFADLSQAESVSINDFRTAFALQRYQEARARYGSRYTEFLAYLGVTSADSRLQRPEYLAGGRQTIQFSEVLQTAEGNDPVGDLKGHGIGAIRSNRYRRFFSEHGYIVTLFSVKPKTMYMQGLARHWSRRTKEDYWQKELQHIGQQEILNKEIYAGHALPDDTFGFQDRYDEYRRNESTVHGDFRSTLDHWHLAQKYANDPVLNGDFVTSTPTKRVFAEQNEDSLWVMANHSMQARRLVTKTGTSYLL